jgi:hypothetical protein
MGRVIAGCVLALGCAGLAADGPREEVKAIASEPAGISYQFQAPGQRPVSCFGSGCAHYYSSAAANGGGSALRLLRTDATIVIVQCKAQDAGHCLMPDANYEIGADFNPSEVRLTMFLPGANGPGAITSETYTIVGVLRPIPGQQMAAPAPVVAASASESGRLPVPRQLEPVGRTAPAAAQENTGEAQAGKTKGRRRRATADDLEGSRELLTYLTHELIDPNRVEARERLAAMGPVHAALPPENPESASLQQEPQGIAPPPEQVPVQQGPVDTAMTPPAPASTIALSEPKELPPAPTKAPLPQGPTDTALAPPVPASTIALAEPKALAPAAPKAPLPQGPVDTALAPASGASTIAVPEPKAVAMATAQGAVPPGQERTDSTIGGPAPIAVAPIAEHAAAPPAASAQVEVVAAPVPVASVPVPAERRTLAVAAPPVAPAPNPGSSGDVIPARVPSATVAPSPVASVPPPSPSVPLSSATAASAPVPSVPVPPPPAAVLPVKAQVAAASPAAVPAQIVPPAARAFPRATQVAEASPAPRMPGIARPEARPAAVSPDVASAELDPAVENPGLRNLEQQITDLDFPVEELAAQWALFEGECPEPTTDVLCLDAKTKVIASTQKVFESKIQLLDKKIAMLENAPQNAIVQSEESEAKDTREKMKVALDSFPKLLVHLDKVLNDLKHADGER